MDATTNVPDTPTNVPEWKTLWWFEQGRGSSESCKSVWERELLPRFPNGLETYLEIGVAEGHSMRWVLENLHPKYAVGIDPYIAKRKETEHYRELKANMKWNLGKWMKESSGVLGIIEDKSQEVLRSRLIPDDLFDLIFVDGSHECLPAITDMVLSWPKLRVGGVMILDDYARRWHLGRPHSKEAIDAFLDAAESRYEWLWGDVRKVWCNQVGIRKIKA